MKKYYFLFLCLLISLSNAQITNLGLGGISMSTIDSNVLNVASSEGISNVFIGRYLESGLNQKYKLSVLAQAPDGTIFGGDSQDGLLIRYDNNSNATVVHTFTNSSDGGTVPINLRYRNGYIYGMVAGRDANNIGSIWKVAVDGSNFTTLHTFTNTGDGYVADVLAQTTADPQGNIYGATDASLFEIDNNDTITFLSTQISTNGLVYRNGYLYADAIDGNGNGMLYKLQTSAQDILDPNTFVDLHDFTASDTFNDPYKLVLGGNGKIYGVADDGYNLGKTSALGHIFSIDANDNINVEYSFHGYTDGAVPIDIIFESNGTTMHGVTKAGGPDNIGTIFTLETNVNHANSPNDILFTSEYLMRNEFLVGFTISTTSDVDVLCMPSGIFFRLFANSAMNCPSPKDNAVYLGRNVSNIPTQSDYIAAPQAVVLTSPFNNNQILPSVQSPLSSQQSMLINNLTKYDVLSFADLNGMKNINKQISALFKKSGLLSSDSKHLTQLSQEQRANKVKTLGQQIKAFMATNRVKDIDGDTFAVGRYLNNASSTGSGGITNNTNVPLDVMCYPENKRYVVPANTSMYCQAPYGTESDGASGIYIGYNIPDNTDISTVVSATIDYARGVDYGTLGSQDVWSNLNSGHSIYLKNFSNYERIVVSGTPDGWASSHCPDTLYWNSRLQGCFIMYYDTTATSWPAIDDGRIFFSTLQSGYDPDPGPNFSHVTSKSIFYGTEYGYYSNYSATGYSVNVVNDSYSTTTQSLVTNQISGNTEFNKIPPTYLQDNTNNVNGVTTLCEPSDSFQINLPNTSTIPKYSQGEVWAYTLLATTGAVIIAIILLMLITILISMAMPEAAPATLGLGIALVLAMIAGAGIGVGAYNMGSDLAGETSTSTNLPAVGSVCYADDQRLYEGTFTASNAWGGESALADYARTNLESFGQVNMGNATSYNGSSQLTADSQSYVNEITGFNNLTNHIITKENSGGSSLIQSIYYTGY